MTDNVSYLSGEQRSTIEGVVHALSLIVGTRDPYTAGHQRRVAELAGAIAREMYLSEWQAEGIRVTGLLHDIGKTAIPIEILSKPGPISEDEFGIVKSHPEVGFEMLKGIAFPWPVAQVTLQHHERLDGSGYPLGLSRQEVTAETRILSVADVIEAMVSHRPYRPALTLENALQHISQGKGTLYDKDVVDACLRLFHRRGFKFEQPAMAETYLKPYINTDQRRQLGAISFHR